MVLIIFVVLCQIIPEPCWNSQNITTLCKTKTNYLTLVKFRPTSWNGILKPGILKPAMDIMCWGEVIIPCAQQSLTYCPLNFFALSVTSWILEYERYSLLRCKTRVLKISLPRTNVIIYQKTKLLKN